MAHRVRSRTAESADNKKTKGTPRRLTEKIAIMRRREHEQSEAFQNAMKSIFEMQQAQQARANPSIHSGGGSMPSLAAIDSTPVPPSIDMQSVFNDLNEVTMRSSPSSTARERPHSGGPTGRRSQFDKRTQSCDTDPYPTSLGTGHMEQRYLHQPATDWMDGDLSRHKSDSDLQQSLLTQQQPGHPGMLNQHFSPLIHPQIPSSTSHTTPPPPPSFLNNKSMHATPNDLAVWGKQKRPASISTATSLLSPEAAPHVYHQNTLSAPGPGTASSSLPDLTNIEFQSGLDVPLERDEPAPQTTPLLPHQPHPPPQQQMFPYQTPPTQPGGFPASNLLFNSFQAAVSNTQPPPTSYITSHAYFHQPLLPNVPSIPRSNHPLPAAHPFNHQPQLPPSHHLHPLSKNIPALNLNPSANYRPSHFGSLGPPFHVPLPGASGAVRKTPTAQTFQNLGSGGSSSSVTPQPQNRVSTAYQPLHPLLPSLINPTSRGNQYQGVSLGGPNISPALQSTAKSSSVPPQMNVVIQPPIHAEHSPGVISSSTPSQPFSPPHSSLQAQSPLSFVQSPPSPGAMSLPNDTNHQVPPVHLGGGGTEPTSIRGQFPVSSISSLPATPTITISPGFSALPSYLAARQQQDLQEKFASFGMHKTEHLIRSHSEENLQQKVQKERGDLMHNPFMGNLANANSVPCVYVDSPSNENIAEHCDSPTTGDSPSTSASYASSPPSVRPFWIDQHQANDFVFHGHEWPMMEGGGGGGGGGSGGGPGGPVAGATGTTAPTDKTKPGSPISHHKSLTDLNAPVEFAELSPRTNRNLQLSLPSIVMSDLAMDEQGDKPISPVVFSDYNVEDAVMDTLLKQEDLSGLQNFDMGFLTTDILMTGSPDSVMHKNLQF